jgi:hypothetical protein
MMKSRLIALTIVFAVTAAKADERLISFIDGQQKGAIRHLVVVSKNRTLFVQLAHGWKAS